MKIGIMGAMSEEISGIVAQIETYGTRRIGNRDFIEGTWKGINVVVVFSRWGKVAASLTTCLLVTQFGVDGVFFVGVAGATDPDLRLGDVVIATDLIQHDMDASAIPAFARFEVPLLGKIRFSADARWSAIAMDSAKRFLETDFDRQAEGALLDASGYRLPRIVSGPVATGDVFITDAGHIAELRSALTDLRCIEMEGASVAQACFELGVPFAVVRIMSDSADQNAVGDFSEFVARTASVMAVGIAARFVEGMARTDRQSEATPRYDLGAARIGNPSRTA